MTGPAVRFQVSHVTRTFTVVFKLVEPEPVARGKFVRRGKGYWLPAVFTQVNAEGRWFAGRDGGPYVIADARGYSMTQAGRKGADFQRTFRDQDWDGYDDYTPTPSWARDIIDCAKGMAIGWGWPLEIKERGPVQ